MNIKLGEIAYEILFGSYEKPKDEGRVKYLYAGHFDDTYMPTKFEGSYVELNSSSDKFLLRSNDVILAGKGHRIFAWAYDPDFGQAIPSSLFYIIRTNPEKIFGEYLASLLNSEKMQHKLNLIGSGATITSIPKKELVDLDIVVPSISKQLKLMELSHLLNENISLTKKLLKQKETLKRGAINKMINNLNK
ncbi:hypothetical protein WNY78_02515 [Psychroserpens sp. AS72]|uniref:hypothetical protein n=1 Tax=Psychroserpens sp. AS72 TaxID=3135775 RepID=UPI003176813E